MDLVINNIIKIAYALIDCQLRTTFQRVEKLEIVATKRKR
jgi:hypothetical protein